MMSERSQLLLPLGVLLVLALTTAAFADDAAVLNGGFEQLGGDGVPADWKAFGPHNWEAVADAAHSGALGLRFRPCEKQQWLRQQQGAITTRAYVVSGWFKANGMAYSFPRQKEEHARLYVHVLYQDRPYSDGLQAYTDIPPGSYDWRRFSVYVAPNPSWPISDFWVTVTAQFPEGELLCDDVAVGPAPFMGGATVLDWENGAKPLVVTDMTPCQPATALAATRQRGKWKVLDYEIGPYTGKLLSANPDAQAAPVTLPLEAKGWHAVYLGLMEGKVRVKLTSDPAFVGRVCSRGPVEDVFFKAADLTGQSLVFVQQSKGHPVESTIAYVKLVPLSDREVARIKADRANAANRRLCTTIDGFSYIYEKGPTTAEDILEEVEEFRDSDIGVLHICVGGAEMVNYPSQVGVRIGVPGGQLMETYPRDGDRTYAESLLALEKAGVNPTRVLIEAGKRMGMKVHVSIRPGAWEFGPPYEEFFASPFYQAHPEWRCVDRDGTPVARMSLAVPEVRRHLVEVLREAVGFGAGGANIIFVRGVPYVLWEEPFCRLFQEKYGEDAHKVDESDRRLTDLRVEIMTGFMREVRAMLDEEQARRGDGRKLELSAFVLANEEDNLKYGIDVRGWCAKGLLDEVSPYLGAAGGSARDYDLGFFKQACGEKGVPWRPTIIGWGGHSLPELMSLALRYYDGGATGITFWDGNALTARGDTWSVVSRLGHVEEVRALAEIGAPTPLTLRPHRIGDFILDGRYGPTWGY